MLSASRLPVKFVLKDYEANVPENTPPGSVILTAGVNKIDPVSLEFKKNPNFSNLFEF